MNDGKEEQSPREQLEAAKQRNAPLSMVFEIGGDGDKRVSHPLWPRRTPLIASLHFNFSRTLSGLKWERSVVDDEG